MERTLREIGLNIEVLIRKIEGSNTSDDPSYLRLTDEIGRYMAWSESVNLCDGSHKSLDYSCRDSTSLYEYAKILLDDVYSSLNKGNNPLVATSRTLKFSNILPGRW